MIKESIPVQFTSYEQNYTKSLPEHYPLLPVNTLTLQPAAYAQVIENSVYVAILIPLMSQQQVAPPGYLDLITIIQPESDRITYTFNFTAQVNTAGQHTTSMRLATILCSVAAPPGLTPEDRIRIGVYLQHDTLPLGNVGKVVMDANMLPTDPSQ